MVLVLKENSEAIRKKNYGCGYNGLRLRLV